MRTEPRTTRRQWRWFLLLWAAGVTLFGVVIWLLRAAMHTLVGG